ncbi:PD40 domain-containing protein [Chloroflexus sp. Y-396-1]|uniref:PD40 domain-containing protein n=1 Tax=Chloroflexus sp. Y-396-1 TaxID=867845 RepID=UPI0004B37966|nr:PD40 domain-containing protein [Chloroflexus sp. Y-396-1]
MKRLLSAILLCLLLSLLSACASTPVSTTPTPPAALQGDTVSGRILFCRDDGIWLWEERTARRLISPPATQPAFSPSGEQIAYVTVRDGASDLLIADQTGTVLTQLTDHNPAVPVGSLDRVYRAVWAFYPTWLPDGNGILAAVQTAPPVGDPPVDAPLALFRYDMTGQRQPVFSDSNAHLGRSIVLPTGDLIAVRTPLGSDSQQQLVRIVNGRATPLAGAPTPAYDPAISPDGNWLIFAVGVNGGSDLYALPVDGGAPVRLTDIGTARAPVFAPDGNTLAFLAVPSGGRGFDLFIAEVTITAEALSLGPPRRLSTDFAINADGGLSWTK